MAFVFDGERGGEGGRVTEALHRKISVTNTQGCRRGGALLPCRSLSPPESEASMTAAECVIRTGVSSLLLLSCSGFAEQNDCKVGASAAQDLRSDSVKLNTLQSLSECRCPACQ